MPAQLPLGVQLRDSSLFASFFAGRNQATVDTLLSLSTSGLPRVVWIAGPHGTGKTHLLQALCARATQRSEQAAYLPLARLDNPEVLAGFGGLQWVCIDDAQLACGNDGWERRLFALHQELDEQGGRMIVASVSTPQSLEWRLADLASRLRAGLLLRLTPLNEAEQTAALRLRAHLRGLELTDEVALYLLRRLPRDMTTLCECLDQLDRAALVAQRRLTIPFVKSILDA